MSTKIPFGGKPEPEDPLKAGHKASPDGPLNPGSSAAPADFAALGPIATPILKFAAGGASVKSYDQEELPPGVIKNAGPGYTHEVGAFTFGVNLDAHEAWDLDSWIASNAGESFSLVGPEGHLAGKVDDIRFTKVDEDSGVVAIQASTLVAFEPFGVDERVTKAQAICLLAADSRVGSEMFVLHPEDQPKAAELVASSVVAEAVAANPLKAAYDALRVALSRYETMGVWDLQDDDPLLAEANMVSQTVAALGGVIGKQEAEAPVVNRVTAIRNQLADLAEVIAEPQTLSKPDLTRISGEILALAKEYRSIKAFMGKDTLLTRDESRRALYRAQHHENSLPPDIFNRLKDCGLTDGETILTMLQEDNREKVRTFAMSRVFCPVPEGPEFNEELDTFAYLIKHGISAEAILASATPDGVHEIGRHFEQIHATLLSVSKDGLLSAIDRLGQDTMRRIYNYTYLDKVGKGADHLDAVTVAEQRLALMGLDYSDR